MIRAVVVAVAASVSAAAATTWDGPGGIACRVWNDGRIVRRGFVCGAGEGVTGAAIDRRGRVWCVFHGSFDGQCITIAGCGLDQVACASGRSGGPSLEEIRR